MLQSAQDSANVFPQLDFQDIKATDFEEWQIEEG